MLNQPVNQVRLTNVALIKLKVENKKYEIACYKNKAINWRNGVEKDIDEVLQSHEIYSNASKGEIAGKVELNKYFPKMSRKDILKLILDKGSLQISEKERENQYDNMFKEIANILAEKCVHSVSKRHISYEAIYGGIKDIHYAPALDRVPKAQALRCLKKLARKFYITRSEMQIKISCLKIYENKLIEELEKEKIDIIEKIDKKNDIFEIVCLIIPHKYRILNEIAKSKIKNGKLEVVVANVANNEVQTIEEAGLVNLEIRKDYKEGNENISSSEDEEENISTNKPNKKKKKKNKLKNAKKNDEKNNDLKIENKFEEKKYVDPNENEGLNNTENNEEKQNVKKYKCTTCKHAIYDNSADFKNHYRSDWHNFNLKLKVSNKDVLNESDYQLIKPDLVNNKK